MRKTFANGRELQAETKIETQQAVEEKKVDPAPKKKKKVSKKSSKKVSKKK